MSGYVPASGETNLAKIVLAIQNLYQGRSNAFGSFTITANVASTTVTAPNCATASTVMLMPQTANAAAALATTSIVAAQGSFTVTHANNAQTDRIFGYAIAG